MLKQFLLLFLTVVLWTSLHRPVSKRKTKIYFLCINKYLNINIFQKQFFHKMNKDFLPTSLNDFEIFFCGLFGNLINWNEKRKFLPIPFLKVVWRVAKEWILTLKVIGSLKNLPEHNYFQMLCCSLWLLPRFIFKQRQTINNIATITATMIIKISSHGNPRRRKGLISKNILLILIVIYSKCML